ncbi:MAG: response regulator [Gemmatimonadota bacterium]|nr:response regulator [Gemmatimonadota bacterium]
MPDAPHNTRQLKYQLAGTGTQRAIDPRAPRAAGPLVLVVDDDADIVRFIGAVLKSHGVETVAAFDAIQGFLVAQRQLPAAILVDWHMPAGGGPQLLRRLQGQAKTSAIPVVVITGDTSEAIPEQATSLGARALLAKPVTPEQLFEAVRGLLGL